MAQPRITVTMPAEVRRVADEIAKSLGCSVSEVVAECVRRSALSVWRGRYPQRATDLGMPNASIDEAERRFRERLNLGPAFWDPRAAALEVEEGAL